MVGRAYAPKLQLNKANASDTEAPFLDLHLSISNRFVSSNIYDKHDDFDFDIVNFPYLDWDASCSTSYSVYISQLIRFARVSSHMTDFNTRDTILTGKFSIKSYRYHKLRQTFYPPTFEEVEGTYWFGPVRLPVCPSVCLSIHPSVHYAV